MKKKVICSIISLLLVLSAIVPAYAEGETETDTSENIYIVSEVRPGLRSDRICSANTIYYEHIPVGTELCITEIVDGSGKTVYNGHEGWISMAYVYPKGEEISSERDPIPDGSTRYFFMADLRPMASFEFYSEASRDSAVISYLPIDYNPVYITEIFNGFGKTIARGHEGWIPMEYLSLNTDRANIDSDAIYDSTAYTMPVYAVEKKTLKDICESEETLSAVEAMKESDELEFCVLLNYPESEKFSYSLENYMGEEHEAKLNELINMNKAFSEKFAKDYSLKDTYFLEFTPWLICKLTLDDIRNIMNDERLEAIEWTYIFERNLENDENGIDSEVSTDMSGPVYPNNDETGRKWLKEFCEFIVGSNDTDTDIIPEQLFVGCTTEIYNMAKDYLDNPEKLKSMNLTQTMDEYHKLCNMLRTITQYAVDDLIDVASKETNNNGYCEEKLWNEFTAALENVKKNRTNTSYKDYSNLKSLLGRILMLSSKAVVYDVNRDGVLDLTDVTDVQKYLAELITFSSSQKYVVSTKEYGDVNLETVVQMQKIIADLTDASDIERGEALTSSSFGDTYVKPLIGYYSESVNHDILNFEITFKP